jgi:hypothetical protein
MGEKQKILQAIQQLESELRPYDEKCESELKERRTRELGLVRREILKECRRKLFEIACTVKFGVVS